jgi:hypothetical protein
MRTAVPRPVSVCLVASHCNADQHAQLATTITVLSCHIQAVRHWPIAYHMQVACALAGQRCNTCNTHSMTGTSHVAYLPYN